MKTKLLTEGWKMLTGNMLAIPCALFMRSSLISFTGIEDSEHWRESVHPQQAKPSGLYEFLKKRLTLLCPSFSIEKILSNIDLNSSEIKFSSIQQGGNTWILRH